MSEEFGRPSIYNDEMPEKALGLMKIGASIVEICAELDITRETFYDWTNKESPRYKPHFSDTVTRGRVYYQAWWEKEGRTNLSNKDFNANLWRINVQNRFRDEWAEIKHVNYTGQLKVIKPDFEDEE